ncbi:MAG TPA: serpin family protein, partial [Clostridiaceae bacterium]|nr:serpin family protein [Clostridiaceae bacterium]
KTDLLNALEEFGLGDLLGFDADFSGIYDGDIAVSAISQETFIALDEKGVEAAAMTDMRLPGSAAPVPREVLELHLDRPFLFVISDPAGVPLFVGIVRNPA